MKIQIQQLRVHTRKTIEIIPFSPSVTFLHGPIGKGKSTVARLIDYCLGGGIERTPAIQREFVSSELTLTLGVHVCTFERSATDSQSVRVSWENPDGTSESVNAPFEPEETPLVEGVDVFNLSDLIFHLCDVSPIKVRRGSRDPDSPLVRLSFRDLMWYCYLDQTHLDSSFFRLEDTFRGRKSQDAMRFFTGLHSERLNQLDSMLIRKLDQQRGKREAVQQIRAFMTQFGWDSGLNLLGEIDDVRTELSGAEALRNELEATRLAEIHPTDDLRVQLRSLGAQIAEINEALSESEQSIEEQKALRAELITAKIKADRSQQASQILDGVNYHRCPQCGTDVAHRALPPGVCCLCCSDTHGSKEVLPSMELEALRRDLNERIDQIADSIHRRGREIERSRSELTKKREKKSGLDLQLQKELARYDSAFVERIRDVERRIATLKEREHSLLRLQKMPAAVDELESQAGSLQGEIDNLRSTVAAERARLKAADHKIAAIAAEFKRILLAVSFPGIYEDDYVEIDPRNWNPLIVHDDLEWGFWDTGSGGKKTAFNVCYALAVHSAARATGMPVPSLLIIDSPTKNISDDENPELVRALYDEIYKIAAAQTEQPVQLLLIDSHLVPPGDEIADFVQRRMAGESDAPSLISYYVGP
ncbi:MULTISPECIES: AAA family ATPase [unclassified Paraburkholderia]|uniref:AAA family ATPase n=1 Tax=unclassified Paraburkholderia TaxID=2615204 RepID=UPI002AB0DBF8|nr:MULTISPECIES: AAA family ATPase [unclassified Paraburkholderia]